MHELLQGTLIDLTEALRARRASPVELMQAVLARIEQTHPALNAVVAMHDPETLLERAREAEGRIARGEARPLEGVPLGVKDRITPTLLSISPLATDATCSSSPE